MLERILKPMSAPIIRIITIILRLLTTTVSIMHAKVKALLPDTTQTVYTKMMKESINQMSISTLIESQQTKKDLTTIESYEAK